ncbi:hypothetical protein LTR70_007009 [Exophiala xenobiotica]|uniref:Uncharacterized protein n=1 Tax=Lithohypha guttulata TaxID=1690604 RepID=A0ABR0K554_9EURO|nr:hypothetical protein LTR24_006874 [Lithohypha guttulata]KAK5314710.1 hypothetical protein LTR70_007009 [Exophiala xenobiotica]
MPKAKSLRDLFREIGIERSNDQKTIKDQILEYLDKTCGSREQAVHLKRKGLSNLMDRFLNTRPGRHHFLRDKSNDEWLHICSRDEVVEALTDILIKWFPGLKRKSSKTKAGSGSSLEPKPADPEVAMPPRRMSVVEMEAEQAIEDNVDEEEELPDLSEILATPSKVCPRDTEEATVSPESVVLDTVLEERPARCHPSVRSHSQPASSPSAAIAMTGSSGTKRKHQETIKVELDHGEETEDETDEEDFDEPIQSVSGNNKRGRIDRSPTLCQPPSTSKPKGKKEGSTGMSAPSPRSPHLASPSSVEDPNQPSITPYHINIPTDLFTRASSQDRAYWPALISHMIRDRQHASQTRLDAERNELHEGDCRVVNTVSRVLQDLHDDFVVIKMVAEGRRREYEDDVRRMGLDGTGATAGRP